MANGSGNVSSIVNFSGGTTTNSLLTIPEGSLSTLGYKTLTMSSLVVTAADFYAFYDLSSGSNAIYQVPSGKRFYVTSISCWSGTASADFQLGTATATFTNGTGSAPTGAVYQTGATSIYPMTMSPTVNIWQNSSFPLSFGPLLFPFVQPGTNAGGGIYTIMIIGKEA